jgi:hypothetical protein
MLGNRILALTAVLLAAFLLASCGAPMNNSSASPIPTTQSPETISTTHPSAPSDIGSPTAPAYPLYFPMPYYRTFFENPLTDDIDRFLHDTAVNYYTARGDARSGSLLIISLRILDEWDAGDGATYYLCLMAEYDYYDLARQLIENNGTYDDPADDGTGYSLGGLVRFKVTPFDYGDNDLTNYWSFKAVEILEPAEGGTPGRAIN